MQQWEFDQFLNNIMQTKLSNKMKDFYFKIASLCRLKKATPLVQCLNIGSEKEEELVTDLDQINSIMAKMIRKEFSAGSNVKVKYPIKRIQPIDVNEL